MALIRASITNPDNAAVEFENHIKSNVTAPGVYHFLYKIGGQESIVQVDARNLSSVESYYLDLDGRAVTAPVQQGLMNGLRAALPNARSQLFDVSGEKRQQALRDAILKGGATPDYRDRQPRLSVEKGIEGIESYKAAKFKASQAAVSQGLHANSFLRKIRSVISNKKEPQNAPQTPQIKLKPPVGGQRLFFGRAHR